MKAMIMPNLLNVLVKAKERNLTQAFCQHLSEFLNHLFFYCEFLLFLTEKFKHAILDSKKIFILLEESGVQEVALAITSVAKET
ncbi:hypothetical protein L596_008939 [Steinernema carpocapsae]|uniref:Uncharacterized protein n=1 Tax=Steinernema carpocapsae TaxID=34508 RepID=A0A4U5PE59_STECR|nr:hypothetical protein L596_008939 [Steinernema carpocapsae]